MSESTELTHQNPKTGTMRITQERLDRTDLVVLVDHDGFVDFSAIGRDDGQVVRMLQDIAKALENGTLDQSFRA